MPPTQCNGKLMMASPQCNGKPMMCLQQPSTGRHWMNTENLLELSLPRAVLLDVLRLWHNRLAERTRSSSTHVAVQ